MRQNLARQKSIKKGDYDMQYTTTKEKLNDILFRRRSAIYVEPDILKKSEGFDDGKYILINLCKSNLAEAG